MGLCVLRAIVCATAVGVEWWRMLCVSVAFLRIQVCVPIVDS